MIVVLGRPALGAVGPDGGRVPGGLASLVAVRAAGFGSPVELVGSVGDDVEGDRAAVGLGQAGVGHAALLRDPAGATPVKPRHVPGDMAVPAGRRGPLPRLDAADVDLGLRYLSACRVLVIADPLDDAAAAAAVDAAAFHDACVVALVAAGEPVPGAYGPAVTALEIPSDDGADGDEDGLVAFVTLVARYAVGLDAGAMPAAAFADATRDAGWERATGD